LSRVPALVAVLEDRPPDAIYASQYRRTQDTLAPAAARFGREVRIDPVEWPIEDWAQAFAERLTGAHAGETVLVVGHSNTVAVLVAALCRCEVEPIDDSVYDRRSDLLRYRRRLEPVRVAGVSFGTPLP